MVSCTLYLVEWTILSSEEYNQKNLKIIDNTNVFEYTVYIAQDTVF